MISLTKVKNINNINPVAAGFIGSLALGLIYFSILAIITRDLSHPWEQFLLYKYWMGALILGFGVQIGLLQFIRSGKHSEGSQAKTAVTSSAGITGAAMVACCAHHGLEVLPFLGATAAGLLVTKYQTQILALGVFSNLTGIFLMVLMIKRGACSLNPFRVAFK